MTIRDLETMYLAELGRARDDARILIGALSELVAATDDPELADALRAHVNDTSRQVDGLGQMGATQGADEYVDSDAMLALVTQALRTIPATERGALRDVAMIGALQHIQHYLIATFGTLAAYAKILGRHDEKRILGAILEDERAFDEDLTVIATGILEPDTARVAA